MTQFEENIFLQDFILLKQSVIILPSKHSRLIVSKLREKTSSQFRIDDVKYWKDETMITISATPALKKSIADELKTYNIDIHDGSDMFQTS